MKCPYCNSDKFAPIVHNNPNIKYALTEVNIETKEFNPDTGIPVDAYGCPDCKSVLLKCFNI